MIRLRKLQKKDAANMLEWILDSDINCWFDFNFENYTILQAEEFITISNKDNLIKKNIHFAIINNEDEYLGTVSLKNVTLTSAEYAIALRKKAIGKKIGYQATQLILEYAFLNLQLEEVYLNVVSDNIRAINMYKKCGFIYVKKEIKKIRDKNQILKWYRILKDDWYKNGKNHAKPHG